MIPRHRPPFNAGRVLLALLSRRTTLAALEDAYEAACAIPHALWVPSARAGMAWAFQETLQPGDPVVCPAYTCMVVHESVVRAGMDLRLVDTQDDSFLPTESALVGKQAGRYAVILSELFGHTFDLARLAEVAETAPRLRIVDMAQTVPVPALLDRLGPADIAFLSFGPMKCMYAGWGGIGLTRDAALADGIRARRDRCLHGERGLTLRRAVRTAGWAFAHSQTIYAVTRGLRERRRTGSRSPRNGQSAKRPTALPAAWQNPATQAPEWYLAPTRVDLGLAMYNLKQAPRYGGHRVAVAKRYQEALANVPGVVLPPPSLFPLSHYSVRVPAEARSEMRRALWHEGFDTATIYQPPGYISPEEFPNTHRIASEILNLPLTTRMTLGEVDRVADAVRAAAGRCIGRAGGG